MVHSKARSMVLRIVQPKPPQAEFDSKLTKAKVGFSSAIPNLCLFSFSMRSLVICKVLSSCAHSPGAKYLSQMPNNQETWSQSECPLDVLCYCCLLMWTAVFVSHRYFAFCQEQLNEPLQLSCELQLQNEQGSYTTTAPDLIFSLFMCWGKIKVNSCWMSKFTQWLTSPPVMDPVRVMNPTNTAIVVCNVCCVSMKMCICDPSVWHQWLWFCFPIPTLRGNL